MATPAEAAVRSACSSLLSGLDEDVMEYIVEMFINGDDTGEALASAVSEFLLGNEYCTDDVAAAAKARELMAAITPAGDAAGPANAAAGREADPTAPRLLAESVNLAQVGGELFKQPDEYVLGGRLIGIEEALEDRKKRKAAREEERRATRRMYEKVAAQRKMDDDLLQEARVAAVVLRRERGAYMGSVEAKPFSMPNPGGGPDLIENATFTLQRGRRYGLIGRNGTGKSTLLRNLASRQLGDVPAALTIHYVSQEVKLDEVALTRTPLQVVLEADVERTLLQAESKALQVRKHTYIRSLSTYRSYLYTQIGCSRRMSRGRLCRQRARPCSCVCSL